MAKDYAKGRVQNYDENLGVRCKLECGGSGTCDHHRLGTLYWIGIFLGRENKQTARAIRIVKAAIREAAAEAIRDTKRSERRRAARLVRWHWNNMSDDDTTVKAILGKKGAKR